MIIPISSLLTLQLGLALLLTMDDVMHNIKQR